MPCSQQASTQRKIINLNLSQKMSFACSMPSTAFFGRNHIRSFARFLCWRGCSNIWTGNSFISLQKLKSNILKFNSFMLAVFILFSRCMKATNEKVSPFAQWNLWEMEKCEAWWSFCLHAFHSWIRKCRLKARKIALRGFFVCDCDAMQYDMKRDGKWNILRFTSNSIISSPVEERRSNMNDSFARWILNEIFYSWIPKRLPRTRRSSEKRQAKAIFHGKDLNNLNELCKGTNFTHVISLCCEWKDG